MARYMDQGRSTFNVGELLRQRVDGRAVVDYYKQIDYGYREYHSAERTFQTVLNASSAGVQLSLQIASQTGPTD